MVFQSSETYDLEYALPESSALQRSLFSAFTPGAEHDAANGVRTNTLNQNTVNLFRNFYSSKFISLRSLTSSKLESFSKGMAIFSEGVKGRNCRLQ